MLRPGARQNRTNCRASLKKQVKMAQKLLYSLLLFLGGPGLMPGWPFSFVPRRGRVASPPGVLG
jgi:hypothetical protein